MAITDPQLARILSDLVSVLGGTTSSLAGFNRQMQQAATATGAAARQMSASRAIGDQLENLNERYAEAGRRTGRLSDDFDRLRQATNTLEQGTDRTGKLMQINNLQLRASFGALKELFSDQIKNTLIEGAKSIVRGLQTGVDPIAVANTINQSVVALATGVAKGMGNFLKNIAGAAGSAVTMLTKAFGPVGSAVGSKLGPIVSGLTSATGSLLTGAADLATFTAEILATELEKTTKAFSTITASGAIFADGMTGMRNSASDAGMTLTNFVAAVQKNSDTLARAGLGVAGGSQKMGAALAAGGDTMRMQLLNLGFSFEEQAGLVAEVMADMRQAGEAQLQPQAVAEATKKYAENLRVISAITGEDAKKRVDAARQAANQLALQEKLAGMDENQRTNIINAMANMSDLQRKNFTDTMIFGSVINKEGAAAAAMSSGLSDSVNDMAQAALTGRLTPEMVRDINRTYGETIKAQALELGSTIGAAGAAGVGGIVGSLADLFSKEVQERMKMSPKAISEAEAAARALKNTTEGLTADASKIAINVNAMQVQFEKLVGPKVLPLYATMTESLTGLMVTASDKLDTMIKRLFGESAVAPTAPSGQLTPEQQQAREANLQQRAAAMVSERLAKENRDIDAAQYEREVEAQAARLSQAEGLNRAYMRRLEMQQTQDRADREAGAAMVSGMPPNARGGILSGPRTGYLARLDGIEAVVPLGDNRKIPVEIKGDSEVASNNFNSLIEVVKEQTSKFDDLLAANMDMLRVLQQSRDISRDLRDNYA